MQADDKGWRQALGLNLEISRDRDIDCVTFHRSKSKAAIRHAPSCSCSSQKWLILQRKCHEP